MGKDKLGMLVDENDVSHSEANANDLERFINFHSELRWDSYRHHGEKSM